MAISSDIRGRVASHHFDVIRGLSAVAVLLYHIRYRFYWDYTDLVQPSVVSKVFYAITSFGHDAVMVFFVLSGFFICSSVVSAMEARRWSWGNYLANRLTRLYLVLIPGLFLTLVWDKLGLTYFSGHPVYTGEPQPWKHDFFDVAATLSPMTCVGNAVFLQTISCAPLGSNAALWSLAYEFWYYLLFPALALVLARNASWHQRLVFAVVAVIVVSIMSRNMLFYFPLWLLGGLVYSVPTMASIRRLPQTAVSVGACVFAAVLVTSHIQVVRNLVGGTVLACDYLVGSVFAVCLWLVRHDDRVSTSSMYSHISSQLSGMSYTLYVVHLPLLVFGRAWLVPGEPWTPGILSTIWFVVIAIVVLAYSWFLSRLTEANTARVRQFVFVGIPDRVKSALSLANA